jgi:hypothetical protein
MRRFQQLWAAAMPALLLLGGCTSRVMLPREKWIPGTSVQRGLVFHAGGSRYEFSRVLFQPDSLIGEYKVTVERSGAGEEVYYEDVQRSYAIPLSLVDSVAVIKRDPGKTLLYGAGVGAVVALIANMADRSLPKGNSPEDQSKPPPGTR